MGEIFQQRYGKSTKYFRNSPYFGFMNLILLLKDTQSFHESELGRLHSYFHLSI